MDRILLLIAVYSFNSSFLYRQQVAINKEYANLINNDDVQTVEQVLDYKNQQALKYLLLFLNKRVL
jgi:hypothetical protein